MSQVFVIITSAHNKSNRIYDGSVEWVNGWRFSRREDIAWRTRSDADIKYAKNPTRSEIVPRGGNDDLIVWVKGKDEKKVSPAELKQFGQAVHQFIEDLTRTHEVFLVYHDAAVQELIGLDSLGALKEHRIYGLGSGQSQFKEILKETTETDLLGNKAVVKYLDAKEEYDKIFRAFFLAPTNVFGFLRHKLVGTLSPIDVDLQTLAATDFDPASWKDVASAYKDGKASAKLRLCQQLVYDETTGLKRLHREAESALKDEPDADLGGGWDRLNALLPEPGKSEAELDAQVAKESELKDARNLYKRMLNVLKGLDTEDLDAVKKNFETGNTFREWLDKVNANIDSLENVIYGRRAVNVGA